jgi:FkbM family methyltransferase
MAEAAQLPLKVRLKLVRQAVYAALSFRGHVPLAIEQSPLGATVTVNGKTIHVPSALRWKLYKKGWRARLDQLEREYGVGHHITLGPASTVLDIGANAGEFAHICARYGARVYCLEPDPKVFACLKANTASLENVSIHDVLIWNENTDIDFFSAPANADSSAFDEGQGPRIKKSAITVEQFCRDNSISKIDLLKCDAEGAEPEMLAGLGAMFSKISVIALDTGAERMGERTNETCAAILKQNGFDVVDEKIGKRLMTYGINKSAPAF